MDPIGILEGLEDQQLDFHQATGVLPAAGLVAPDEAPQNPRVADPVVLPPDRPMIQFGDRHVLLDQLNVLVVLDQVLGDPRSGPVGAGLVGQFALGSDDAVMDDLVVGVRIDHGDLVAPLGRLHRVLLGVGDPELAHRLEILDCRVHAGDLKGGQRVHAVHVRIEMKLLPLVDRHRQPIRLLAVQGRHHSHFGRHLECSLEARFFCHS
jgi:hypothetical protein